MENINTKSKDTLKKERIKKIRVLIVDDHKLIRDAINGYFINDEQFEVIGEASNGEEAMEKLMINQPDVVLTDISMPKKDGIKLTSEIKVKFPHMRIIVLTMHDDFKHIKQALGAMADGFLLKSSSEEEVKKAVKKVAAGNPYFNQEISGIMMNHLSGNYIARHSEDIKSSLAQHGNKIIKGFQGLGIILGIEILASILVRIVF